MHSFGWSSVRSSTCGVCLNSLQQLTEMYHLCGIVTLPVITCVCHVLSIIIIVENTNSINVCWFSTVVTSSWIHCWCVSSWVAVVEVVTTLQLVL